MPVRLHACICWLYVLIVSSSFSLSLSYLYRCVCSFVSIICLFDTYLLLHYLFYSFFVCVYTRLRAHTASGDKTIRLWDDNGSCIRTFSGTSSAVRALVSESRIIIYYYARGGACIDKSFLAVNGALLLTLTRCACSPAFSRTNIYMRTQLHTLSHTNALHLHAILSLFSRPFVSTHGCIASSHCF